MRTAKIWKALIIGAAMTAGAIGQPSRYDDVAVIINVNSSISDSVGMYFAQQRGIPAKNIIRISAPTAEEIDSLQFENLRQQIENHLTTNRIADRINYLVTTKGVPLKVNRGDTFHGSSPSSSVESELTLILGPYASYIGQRGRFTNPLMSKPLTKSFSRRDYGIYLVTRLDGYSWNDIKGLIDRAAIASSSIPSSSTFVFDQDPTWDSFLPYLNGNMRIASRTLQQRGYRTMLDTTEVYITNRSAVLGYVSWGSNDRNAERYTLYARPGNSYVAGAIAETYVSTSGRTFSQPAEYGQSLVADLIAEGVTGVKGYVYEPFSSAMAMVDILFDRYTGGYTLAESYYQASYWLSWMDVIVGDPKLKLGPLSQEASLPVQLVSFSAAQEQNRVRLEWSTATETNNYGFEIQRRLSTGQNNDRWETIGFVQGSGTSSAPKTYSFLDAAPPSGKYLYRLKQIDSDGSFEYSNQIEVIVKTLEASPRPVLANYPNPFNPTTTITFVVPEAGIVSLKVYDTAGREVATLVDGYRPAGEHAAPFDASQLASGVYFSRLQTTQGMVVHKMLLVR